MVGQTLALCNVCGPNPSVKRERPDRPRLGARTHRESGRTHRASKIHLRSKVLRGRSHPIDDEAPTEDSLNSPSAASNLICDWL